MAQKSGKSNHFPEAAALLAATAYLCVKGLKKVEQRLKKPKK